LIKAIFIVEKKELVSAMNCSLVSLVDFCLFFGWASDGGA